MNNIIDPPTNTLSSLLVIDSKKNCWEFRFEPRIVPKWLVEDCHEFNLEQVKQMIVKNLLEVLSEQKTHHHRMTTYMMSFVK
jgi:hypothetical protein